MLAQVPWGRGGPPKGAGAGRCGSWGLSLLISYHTGSSLCPVIRIYGACDGSHLKVLSREAMQSDLCFITSLSNTVATSSV